MATDRIIHKEQDKKKYKKIYVILDQFLNICVCYNYYNIINFQHI